MKLQRIACLGCALAASGALASTALLPSAASAATVTPQPSAPSTPAPGSNDPSFNGGKVYPQTFAGDPATPNDEALAVLADPAGTITTVGNSYDAAGVPSVVISRQKGDGTPATAFGGTGSFRLTYPAGGGILATTATGSPDGSTFVAGLTRTTPIKSFVAHVLANGTADPKFGSNGVVVIPAQTTGHNLVASTIVYNAATATAYLAADDTYQNPSTLANSSSAALYMLTLTAGPGSPKVTTLSDAAISSVSGMALTGGNLVVAGSKQNASSGIIQELNAATGNPVPSFGTGGSVTTALLPEDVAVSPKGDIVTVGYPGGQTTGGQVLEFSPTGAGPATYTLPGGFSTAQSASVSEDHAVAVQSDGTIVVGGQYSAPGAASAQGAVFKVGAAATGADGAFGTGGLAVVNGGATLVTSVALDNEQRIVLAADNGARYQGPGSPATQVLTGRLLSDTKSTETGYRLFAADGGVFDFGADRFFGSLGNIKLNKPVVGGVSTPDTQGYWMVASDGGVFSFGDAGFFGSTGNIKLNKPIVAMAATPDGQGYWLVASDGGVFSFGDARFFGSTGNIKLNKPIVGISPTSDGQGYWLAASDGGVFSFGDAAFYGSTGNIKLNKPVNGIQATTSGGGYYLVASDGGIFTFGDAPFFGSTGDRVLNAPVLKLILTPGGQGYGLFAGDGGVFSFGNFSFYGSTGDIKLASPVVNGSL